MSDGKGTIMLLIISVIWGTSFIFSSIAMNTGLTGTEVVFGRFLIGTVVLYTLFHKKLRFKEMDKNAIKAGVISGAITHVAFILEMAGISLSTTTKAGFLTSTNVIIIPFLYFILLKQSPKKNSLLAGVLTILGIALLTLKDRFIFELGDILLLCTAFCYAINSMAVSTQSKGCSMLQLTYVQFLVVLVLTTISLPFTQRGVITSQGVWAVVYLAIVPTIICYLMKNYVLKFISPVRCAIIQSTQSIFCAVMSVLLLGDIVTGKMFVGMAIIMLAIFVEVMMPNIKIHKKTELDI